MSLCEDLSFFGKRAFVFVYNDREIPLDKGNKMHYY